MRRNKEEAMNTIHNLIEVGRKHFTKHGYEGASLEEIAKEANLTRGALYHHFKNKQGLFEAVLITVQKEVADQIERDARKSDDLWEQLLLGCKAFVTAAVELQNKRILLIDGPAVVGWEVWRSMDRQSSMRLLHEQLDLMQRSNCFKPVSVEAMTHSLSGALNESALWIAQMPEHEGSLDEIMKVISYFVEGFKLQYGTS
ncbi:MAG: TetR/AcrR family transcriptional regulator [Bacillota bacterium]|uniref:TetR/AcrR family transcriptional regulator n=1 Tax=Virgibacillus salarius TaxID=447199 RepID=A0A941ICT5_9BACI|nr:MULTISPECIES: TetR/AcrR family transcriptional regulator [Bacillaceae]NAZ09194.1 TetR family transcriptional regulator [Agaribacter marinus]MBR7796485.1 TetR/AcrR family transcriptional regulator [Virgibacillus salarius]MCC2249527.1 TetR/AcrR family transcriptional regulator [Virgibacillus sp. AGTR]MDY7046641.1 TetR/AcrR family transcriptional regulator [Virgibacillus sp. M23]QRZ19393.1 TetR/AcrR family transcriptional regulator [Virgibacillus sp. AGTR]